MLDIPLTSVKGIGPNARSCFRSLAFVRLELLFRLPRDYLDYTKATPISQLVNGQNAAVQVRISGATRFFPHEGDDNSLRTRAG
jgi:RecG-like helicase